MAVKKQLKQKTGTKTRSTPTKLPSWLQEPPPVVFPSRKDLVKLIAILAIAISVAIACNSLVKFLSRQPKPFCDSSDYGVSPYVSDWCETCPAHGSCINGVLNCEHGYKKHGRRCLVDSKLSQTSKKLSDRVEYFVCKSYASLLCKGSGKVWYSESEIAALLEEVKLKYYADIKNGVFDLTKRTALNSLESSLETRMTVEGYKEFKCPNWLAEHNRPFICAFRQWIHNHMLLILCAFSMFTGVLVLFYKVHQGKRLSARAEQLYAQICQILEETAYDSHKSKNKGEKSVVIAWLRDHLLLPSERKNLLLWKKVEDLIQEDSRIDQYPKLVNGEARIVLEWQAR